jgi:molecular chaperone HscB
VVSPSTSEAPSGQRPDAFALLGLPARYDLSPDQLERAFFERSKDVHADRFATAPAAERVAALARSRALNDAYQLLKRDASRAEYLLERQGVTIGANERVAPELLMEFLEEREALAEARHQGELREVERLQARMRARRRGALDQIRARFAEEPADLPAIKQHLILLRYVERYLEECDAALDED